MNPLIVADIGGTNARFGIARFNVASTIPQKHIIIDHQTTLACDDYSTFTACATHYIKTLPSDIKTKNACFAFAAPIAKGKITMTNNHWTVILPEVKKTLKLERIEAINDFAAQACAISHLESHELSVIKTGTIIPEQNKTILGPGTGLGVGSLAFCNGTWKPIAGEGGHVGFTYPNILGLALYSELQNEHDFLSLETLLSGNGLVNIYRAICKVQGAIIQEYDESDISRLGLNNSVDECKKALTLFCELLGAASGDLALINGSKGGVYLTGGILPRIENFLLQSNFSKIFNQKGKMSHFLNDIPIYLVKKNNPALYGAANWFLSNAAYE
ncbi:MAG: glucokinase [Cellvibrionaceae bacterium]